jgi:hypothetical protein
MAWSRIGTWGEGADATTLTVTARDTRGANFLVAAVIGYCWSELVIDNDSNSNSWQPLTNREGDGNRWLRLFYCYNPTVSATHSFRVTGGDGSRLAVVWAAYSGMDATSAVYIGENGSASMTTGNITPGAIGDLIISAGGFYFDNSYAAPTVSSGSATRIVTANAGSYHYLSLGEYGAVSTSAQGVVWSGDSPNAPVSAIAVFKAASASGPSVPVLLVSVGEY